MNGIFTGEIPIKTKPFQCLTKAESRFALLFANMMLFLSSSFYSARVRGRLVRFTIKLISLPGPLETALSDDQRCCSKMYTLVMFLVFPSSWPSVCVQMCHNLKSLSCSNVLLYLRFLFFLPLS